MTEAEIRARRNEMMRRVFDDLADTLIPASMFDRRIDDINEWAINAIRYSRMDRGAG
tara:strand:- start:478 stop:648 length:171 start_codon:yes stop_codon:yes gene_type:complete